ncbi:MAG: DUF2784 domain-containing protein [Candidatus Accumulibacter sp. UW26]|jgi:hypothetical protein
MSDRLLADGVVVLHLIFIAFVIGGGLLVLRWRVFALLHLPAVCWGVLVELNGWICPLTPLENRLRQAAGDAGYQDSFVEHYLLPILYPAGLTRTTQFALAMVVMLINLFIYACIARRRGRGASAGERAAAKARHD